MDDNKIPSAEPAGQHDASFAALREAFHTYMACPTPRNYDSLLDAIPPVIDATAEQTSSGACAGEQDQAKPSQKMPQDIIDCEVCVSYRHCVGNGFCARAGCSPANAGEDPIGDFQAEARQAKLDDFVAAGRGEARPDLASLQREAARYRWLRDKSEPGICAFYLSVGKAFDGIKFTQTTVDEAIDAQIAADPTKDAT